MITVRRVTLADLDDVMAMLERHIAACSVEYPKPDRDTLTRSVLSSSHYTAPIALLVAEGADGGLAGCAAAVVSRCLWSPTLVAQIVILLVEPEHRGRGRAFLALLNAVEKWAAEKECRQITFTLSSGIDDERTARALSKRGYVRTGIDTVKYLP